MANLILRDGTIDGVVVAGIDNWSGQGFSVPLHALERADVPRSVAVYLLSGSTQEELPVVYVGEADNLRRRLRPDHAQLRRDDVTWHRLLFFTAGKDELHKAHVQWLESELVRRIRDAGRVDLVNSATPRRPHLPEADTIRAERYLDHVLILLSLLGVDAVRAPTPRANGPDHSGSRPSGLVGTQLALTRRGEVVATAVVAEDGTLTLLAGSLLLTARSRGVPRRTRALRERLIASKAARPVRGTDHYRLVRDHAGLNPFVAACLVIDTDNHAQRLWHDADGTSLYDLLREQ